MRDVGFRDYWRSQDGMSWLFLDLRAFSDRVPRWHVWRRYRLGGKLWRAWDYLRCRLWRRYNCLTVKTLHPTWADRDALLLHAAFAIFCDVMEKEDWFHHTSYDAGCGEHESRVVGCAACGWRQGWSETWQEAAQLYDWWKHVRPAREEEALRRLRVWSESLQRDLKRCDEAQPDWRTQGAPAGRSRLFPPEQSEATKAAWARLRELDDEVLTEEDDARLHRLIDIRGALWT